MVVVPRVGATAMTNCRRKGLLVNARMSGYETHVDNPLEEIGALEIFGDVSRILGR